MRVNGNHYQTRPTSDITNDPLKILHRALVPYISTEAQRYLGNVHQYYIPRPQQNLVKQLQCITERWQSVFEDSLQRRDKRLVERLTQTAIDASSDVSKHCPNFRLSAAEIEDCRQLLLAIRQPVLQQRWPL